MNAMTEGDIKEIRNMIRTATHEQASFLWKLLRDTFLLQEYVSHTDLQILVCASRPSHTITNGSRQVRKDFLRQLPASGSDAEILHRCLTLSHGVWSHDFWRIILKTIDR